MSRVLLLDEVAGALAGHRGLVFGVAHASGANTQRVLVSLEERAGLSPIASTLESPGLPRLVCVPEDGWSVVDGAETTRCEVVPWRETYFSRSAGIVDATDFPSGHAVIVGCGSVGGPVAIKLAKSGVCVSLFDAEPVALENLIRTRYSARHIGDPKVFALRELIIDANPTARVRAYRAQLHEALDADPGVLDDADLIVNCASNAVGFEISARFHSKTPMLFPGMHARGASAELFVSLAADAKADACFACYRARVGGATPPARSWNYGGPGGELAAEPALEADIGHLTSITASVALRVLAGRAGEVLQANRRLLLLTNVGGALLEAPFETRWIEVRRDPTCPYHGDGPAHASPAVAFDDIPEVAS